MSNPQPSLLGLFLSPNMCYYLLFINLRDGVKAKMWIEMWKNLIMFEIKTLYHEKCIQMICNHSSQCIKKLTRLLGSLVPFSMHCNSWIKIVCMHFQWNNLFVLLHFKLIFVYLFWFTMLWHFIDFIQLIYHVLRSYKFHWIWPLPFVMQLPSVLVSYFHSWFGCMNLTLMLWEGKWQSDKVLPLLKN